MRKEICINYAEGEKEDKLEIKGTVIMKRLNFSEKNALEEEASDVKVVPGAQPVVKVSSSKMKELAVLKGVESSELKMITYSTGGKGELIAKKIMLNLNELNVIRNLPQDVGRILFVEFTELNAVSVKKNVKSSKKLMA